MKTRSFYILLMLALSWIALPASASRLGDIRVNARFLTDRMAYELRLSNRQYDDIFEINYDFFYNVDPYIDGMSYGDPYALDMYYRYLDERNDDIRWVLSRRHYVRFMSLEHFFLPIYAVNRICYVRIYNVYPNRTHFYYGRPSHYYSYHGGHCRHHHGGISFYQTHYKNHYRHSVYKGNYQSVRTRTRGRDFPKVDRHGLPGRVESGRNTGIRNSSNTRREVNSSHGTPVRRTDRNSESVVSRPQTSDRYRGTSDRNRVTIDRNHVTSDRNRVTIDRNQVPDRHRSESIREHTESVRRPSENSYVRPARFTGKHYETSSTRYNRSEGVSHRSNRSESVSRSQRTSVRQHNTESSSRSRTTRSEGADRSERRGVRER